MYILILTQKLVNQNIKFILIICVFLQILLSESDNNMNKLMKNEYICKTNTESEITENENIENFGNDSNSDGFFSFTKNGKLFCCLTVIGQIEGHMLLPSNHKTTKYEHILPKLLTFETDERYSGLLLLLNTVGGDIEAGMAMAEMIAGLSKPTVSLVIGGGHSIGIPLAVAAKRSFITESATMTVHPVRMNGVVMGVPQQLEYFKNMQERIVTFVCEHSSVEAEEFNEMMLASGNLVSDFGSVLNGQEAVKKGIIDKTGSINTAVEELSNMCR